MLGRRWCNIKNLPGKRARVNGSEFKVPQLKRRCTNENHFILFYSKASLIPLNPEPHISMELINEMINVYVY